MPKKLRLREVSEKERGNCSVSPVPHVASPSSAAGQSHPKDAADPKLSAAQAGRLAGYKGDFSGQLWVNRFNQQGLAGLHDEPRPGHPRVHSEETQQTGQPGAPEASHPGVSLRTLDVRTVADQF
jgi:hypothetical protein